MDRKVMAVLYPGYDSGYPGTLGAPGVSSAPGVSQ